MPARCMVRGNKTIGAELQYWHGSMGDPIYAVGSNWYAGKPATCDSVDRALKNLKLLSYDRTLKKQDRRSLEICMRALKSALRKKGIV